ncbi:MAG: hypothetical protein KAR13_17560 [Desulfobulbaceae bacterium]|nr:hypothetical protein [Desulfobulbaceae bacterium]MCK5436719.1 hypothetical protein [Desulfobulbaceae bacterium]MCK5544402.1 hypothetical protein [Desulfobulbaceae bacterium]
MKFESFEQALQVCLTSENGSAEQDAALVYCMEHAPLELKKMLEERYLQHHTHGPDCGCKH